MTDIQPPLSEADKRSGEYSRRAEASQLRILYFGTYRAEYARNQILIEGLRRAGLEVYECHQALWKGIEDRVQTASGGWLKPLFWLRVLNAYSRLLLKYLRSPAYDILVVGYPGQFDIYLARLLAWLGRKPLAWDVLNSLYLISLERGLDQRSPFTIRLIRAAERIACNLADMLILDTPQFVAWFQQTHGIDARRFRIVPIGADERIFFPPSGETHAEHPQAAPDPAGNPLRVIYYGTYIPNHGVKTIIEAARLVHPGTVEFVMIGRGPEKAAAVELAQQYQLENVIFIDWLEHIELVQEIAAADVVLGAFGDTRQLKLTNNNKIYEGFALKKAVISAASPALPEVLQAGEHLLLCPPADPARLAQAIHTLQQDPGLRQRLGENGCRLFHAHFTVTQIGRRFAAHLAELAARR